MRQDQDWAGEGWGWNLRNTRCGLSTAFDRSVCLDRDDTSSLFIFAPSLAGAYVRVRCCHGNGFEINLSMGKSRRAKGGKGVAYHSPSSCFWQQSINGNDQKEETKDSSFAPRRPRVVSGPSMTEMYAPGDLGMCATMNEQPERRN